MLPNIIQIGQYPVNTFGIFVLIGFVIFTFVFWMEGSKDAFNIEKLFDLMLFMVLSAVVSSRIFFALQNNFPILELLKHTYKVWTPGMSVGGAIFGALVFIYFASRWLKWSLFRILDITALSSSLGFSVIVLGYVALQQNFQFLFAFAAWVLLYVLLSRLRNSKVKSGLAFTVFMLINALLGIVFFGFQKYAFLFIFFVVVAISNLVFRKRKYKMQNILPIDFIEKIKDRLLKKQERLTKEIELLDSQDPYDEPGREDDNADFIDDANEDIEHVQLESQKNALHEALEKVKDALGRIKVGKYGISTKSGQPIDKARLEAYPEAELTAEEAQDEEAVETNA